MKSVKIFCLALALSAVGCAFADAGNALISFSTPGPDRYADGAVVLDNEWYALVWSSDGNFEGIKLDCTPIDPNDEVTLVAPLAEKGCCPYTVFQVRSEKVREGGVYAVYMLDTRNAAKDAPAAKAESGLPAFVTAGAKAAECNGSAVGGTVAKVVAGKWNATAIDPSVPGYEQLKITAFNVENGKVSITVNGMMPGVQYNVLMGADLTNLDAYALDVPKTVSDDPTFVIDAEAAKCFKVVRQPLEK